MQTLLTNSKNVQQIDNVSVLQQMVKDMRDLFDSTVLKLYENEQHHITCSICTKNRLGTMISMPCGQHIMCFYCCFEIINGTMKYSRNTLNGDTKYILRASCCICKDSAPIIHTNGSLNGLMFENNQICRYIEENGKILSELKQLQYERIELNCCLPGCNQSFQSISMLQKHLRICVVDKYTCPCTYTNNTRCNQRFNITSQFHNQNECTTHTCDSCWNLIPDSSLACIDKFHSDFKYVDSPGASRHIELF